MPATPAPRCLWQSRRRDAWGRKRCCCLTPGLCLRRKPAPLVLDQDYVNLKNQIIKAERRVLKELGFCVHVKHPHKVGLRPCCPAGPPALAEVESWQED